ncbi:MAG TPA: hypothetical protein VLB44_19665, partial [Kofleriaceae bacterium]|nr:hypothetical protein [Kofleriaceae bacterium]
MKRFALAFLLLAACSGKSKQSATTGGGSADGSAALYAKKWLVAFGITQGASSAEIFLQTTDETGKQVSHALGTYDGQCQVIKPAAEMTALTAVNCTAGTAGVELDAVHSVDEIVVLKLKVEVGVTPDPMARTEVTRIKVPSGAAVEAGT